MACSWYLLITCIRCTLQNCMLFLPATSLDDEEAPLQTDSGPAKMSVVDKPNIPNPWVVHFQACQCQYL